MLLQPAPFLVPSTLLRLAHLKPDYDAEKAFAQTREKARLEEAQAVKYEARGEHVATCQQEALHRDSPAISEAPCKKPPNTQSTRPRTLDELWTSNRKV